VKELREKKARKEKKLREKETKRRQRKQNERDMHRSVSVLHFFQISKKTLRILCFRCGCSVAEWLACWTQAQKARIQIAVATLSGNSLR